MSRRPPFDASVLQQNKPSQSLKPLDFMRPMEEEPAPDDTRTAEPAPPAEEAPAPRESVRAPERKNTGAATTPAPVERPLFLTPVDPTEKLFNRGFHMYPSRHKQLRDLAYYEDRNPWEIVDQALGEYVKRHYGNKAGK
jgi:hypothetical protein